MKGFLETIKIDDDDIVSPPEDIAPRVSGAEAFSHELEKFYRAWNPRLVQIDTKGKGEYPTDAAVHLKGLSLASDYEHAWFRIKNLKALKI